MLEQCGETAREPRRGGGGARPPKRIEEGRRTHTPGPHPVVNRGANRAPTQKRRLPRDHATGRLLQPGHTRPPGVIAYCTSPAGPRQPAVADLPARLRRPTLARSPACASASQPAYGKPQVGDANSRAATELGKRAPTRLCAGRLAPLGKRESLNGPSARTARFGRGRTC